MNSKITLALSMLCVAAFATVRADESEMLQTKGKHVKKYDCLRVNNELRVCGNELIDGVLTLVNQPVFSPALAVGTPGVPGLGGDLAFGGVGSIMTQTVNNLAPVTFTVMAPVYSGVMQTSTGITVANAGIYRLQASVFGYPEFGGADSLIFELRANNVPIIAAFESSPSDGTSADPVVVSGFGIVPLAAGAVLTLVNSGTPVVLPSGAAIDGLTPATPIANAVLTVERIA